ncbi:MAG: DMT family transporter [Granulosicoccus sp.]
MPERAQALAYTNSHKTGALAVTLGASMWGLFWIPLRYLDNAGISGLWSIALVTLCAALPAILLTAYRLELPDFGALDTWLLGTALGLATVLYFIGVLYSDVVRVVFLFYLLPVWTIISARVIYGEKIHGIKLLVIALSLCGLWLLLGARPSIPLPENPGDWSALAAGFCWGVSLSVLRGERKSASCASAATTLLAACAISTLGALAILHSSSDALLTLPKGDNLRNALLTSTAFGMLAIFPSLLGQIWGAKQIPAATAALLTMSEILVATVSATILIGTELNALSLAGGIVIISAVFLDLLTQYKAGQTNP